MLARTLDLTVSSLKYGPLLVYYCKVAPFVEGPQKGTIILRSDRTWAFLPIGVLFKIVYNPY